MLDNMYKVHGFIWHVLRSYSPMYASLGLVTGIVVGELEEAGCHVTILDAQHRDYRIIEVDGHEYRIFRGKDKFSPYDARIIC